MKLELSPQTRLLMRKLWRNRSFKIGFPLVILFIVLGLIAPYVAPYNPVKGNLSEALQPPGRSHWFGTDQLGRDIFSRTLYGARVSLIVAFTGILLAVIAGVLYGAVSGFLGGSVDEVLMRFIDILLAFPDILLAILVAAIVGPGLLNVIVAIGAYNFPQFARITRGAVLAVKELEYVEAAEAIGESRLSILFRYILPNSMYPVIVHGTLRTGASILTAAALSFLGLGVQPPTPEWGAMINEAMKYLDIAPQMWIFPGLFLTITVLGFNLMGDGLNDVLNPRIKE
ncbi:MAG: ABC transporter permease [Desulfurococcales archaeon]|nr:ABC transporter permease [Desulfurococcales archaeon]